MHFQFLFQDHNDVIKLLAYQNVDNSQLLNFVTEAAEFSTGLPHSEFEVNPDNSKPDVAIFDFTSMYSAEYAAKILERRNKRLIIGELVYRDYFSWSFILDCNNFHIRFLLE